MRVSGVSALALQLSMWLLGRRGRPGRGLPFPPMLSSRSARSSKLMTVMTVELSRVEESVVEL